MKTKKPLPKEIVNYHAFIDQPHTKTYFSDSLKMWFVVGYMDGEEMFARSCKHADKAMGLARTTSNRIQRLLKARQKLKDEQEMLDWERDDDC
jgi:hypothetical protein